MLCSVRGQQQAQDEDETESNGNHSVASQLCPDRHSGQSVLFHLLEPDRPDDHWARRAPLSSQSAKRTLAQLNGDWIFAESEIMIW
jgi:hypothetical protein